MAHCPSESTTIPLPSGDRLRPCGHACEVLFDFLPVALGKALRQVYDEVVDVQRVAVAPLGYGWDSLGAGVTRDVQYCPRYYVAYYRNLGYGHIHAASALAGRTFASLPGRGGPSG